jgi:hypothetical protein
MNILLDLEEYKFRNNDIKNVCSWIKTMPNKKKIQNIFTYSNECYEFELNIIDYFPNCKHFQILKPNIKQYEKCINKIYGNFKFKISNELIEDFTPEPNISYDLIILYHILNYNNYDKIIEKCLRMMNNKSMIIIFSYNSDSIMSIKNKYNNNFLLLESSSIKLRFNKPLYKLFQTSITSTMNTIGISKQLIKKLFNDDLNNYNIEEIINYINKNYKVFMKQKIDIYMIWYA